MRRIFVAFVTIWCAEAQQEVKVTYLTTQASVQDIVKTMARRAGLGYNWHKSFNQTDPQCRKFVWDVRIDAVPFGTAMRQILDPVGLRYEVENDEVVLYRAASAPPPAVGPDAFGIAIDPVQPDAPPPADLVDRRVTYSTGRKTVQYIVIDLATKVGLGYNWNKSFAQTDPECRHFLEYVSIKDQTFDKAMARILEPLGLRYRVESNQVVLYRR